MDSSTFERRWGRGPYGDVRVATRSSSEIMRASVGGISRNGHSGCDSRRFWEPGQSLGRVYGKVLYTIRAGGPCPAIDAEVGAPVLARMATGS